MTGRRLASAARAQRLAGPGGGRLVGRHRAGRSHADRRNPDEIAGFESIVGASAPAVDTQLPASDQPVDVALGDSLALADDEIVQPLAGTVGVDFHDPDGRRGPVGPVCPFPGAVHVGILARSCAIRVARACAVEPVFRFRRPVQARSRVLSFGVRLSGLADHRQGRRIHAPGVFQVRTGVFPVRPADCTGRMPARAAPHGRGHDRSNMKPRFPCPAGARNAGRCGISSKESSGRRPQTAVAPTSTVPEPLSAHPTSDDPGSCPAFSGARSPVDCRRA